MLTPDLVIQNKPDNSTLDHTLQVRRLLLVDDSPEDRESITELIHDAFESVVVEAMSTGEQAMGWLAMHTVDCIVLDYRLEAEDGLEVMSRIKERYPFVPVIVLTGQGDEAIAVKSIKSGASDYLVKDRMSAAQLGKTVDIAISRAALECKIADQDQDRKLFLRTLVHDLRAPLRLIDQLGTIALEETNSGNLEEAKELVIMQNSTARRASALINSLENYALLDSDVTFTSVSLSHIALQAQDNLLCEIAEREAHVNITELPTILGEEAQLVQLFQNLIQNGLKYNKSKNPTVNVRVEKSSENAMELVVEDNGIGVEPHALQRIFAPLQRIHTQDKYEGTGLGLAICKKIVLRHHGKIWCTSTEGKGTTFHMTFPEIPAT